MIDLDSATCEYGEERCGESAFDTCFYCEDPICFEHAMLLPGTTLLRACPGCLAQRLIRRIRSAVELQVARERFYTVAPNSVKQEAA
jgi:hypothetical protein